MQLDIFGDETATKNLPRLNCTNDENCKAEVDEHTDTCPIEQRLREEFGF